MASEQWSEDFDSRTREWCVSVAGLAVDALVDGGVIDRHAFDKGVAIVSEEIYVRLAVQNYPPSTESDNG